MTVARLVARANGEVNGNDEDGGRRQERSDAAAGLAYLTVKVTHMPEA